MSGLALEALNHAKKNQINGTPEDQCLAMMYCIRQRGAVPSLCLFERSGERKHGVWLDGHIISPEFSGVLPEAMAGRLVAMKTHPGDNWQYTAA